MGARIAALGAPRLALCSSARRAVETLDVASESWHEAPRVVHDRALYLAGHDQLVGEILGLADEERAVLLVGHNPGLGTLVQSLARRGPDAAVARLRRGFPTAALAVLGLAGRWRDVHRGVGLEHLSIPSDQSASE